MATQETDPKFEALLQYLQRTRGFDFTGYKRTSLMRRVNRRLELVGLQDYGDYIDYLEVHPEEFSQLFNTILINVTDFYRDQQAWDFLTQQVIPQLINQGGNPIRVWCAGVASGEEAYSIAMTMAEALGEGPFLDRVKIYATDVDEEALSEARQASYPVEKLNEISAERRERFFEKVNSRYVFRPGLRRAVIFGRHDLVQDAPISHLDLLICRNTLMYFNLETQSRILARFHFALKDNGVLFLGKAEMLLTHSSLFSPLDIRYRIFSKVPRADPRDRLLLLTQNGDVEANFRINQQVRLREGVLDSMPVAQIAVDASGTVVMINNRARALFGLGSKELGRPLHELEVSYRPLELRSRIEQAYLEHRPVVVPDVERKGPDNTVQYFDVEVNPVQDNDGMNIGANITFTDSTRCHELQEELRRSKQDLETAYEELQSANEELETTNEELQSTVEELQTTNEELQSSNEELETMNEELQSTNEELETTNTELRRRTDELNESNSFQTSILSSLDAGVIVVDRNLNVIAWNDKAEDLWGMRADETQHRSIFNLDIGLPVDQLGGPIRACLSTGERQKPIVVDAVNRRGKTIRCRLTISPLGRSRTEIRGVIAMTEEIEA